MISREMNAIEIEVLNLIANKGSFEKPISSNSLQGETGLSKRPLEQVIESLRVNFGHHIVAKKFKPNGYYLPKNQDIIVKLQNENKRLKRENWNLKKTKGRKK